MPEMSPDQVPDELVELFDETAKNALLTQTRLEDVDRIALAAVVARVRAEEYCKADAETEMVFNDLRAILRALGLSDAARPYSAHEVVQRDILPAIERVRAHERHKIADDLRRDARALIRRSRGRDPETEYRLAAQAHSLLVALRLEQYDHYVPGNPEYGEDIRTLMAYAKATTAEPDAKVTYGATVERRSADDRAKAVRDAKRRLRSRLIASAHLLDAPFANAEQLSPWVLIKRDMAALDEALRAALAATTGKPEIKPVPDITIDTSGLPTTSGTAIVARGATRKNGAAKILKAQGWYWLGPIRQYVTREQPLADAAALAADALRAAGLTVEIVPAGATTEETGGDE